MKNILCIAFLLIVFALSVLTIKWFVNYCSVGTVNRSVLVESHTIQDRIDDRYQKLDAKLDRIEGKLDRLLKIAERPLPDGMQEAQ